MSENIVLPALGESVTEGTVTRWLKSVGDEVAVDEPLLEVSTDKVDTEIPSPISGILEEILVEEDETVEVGAILARVGDGSSSTSDEEKPEQEAKEPEPEPTAQEPEPEPAEPEPVAQDAVPEPAPAPAPEPAPAPASESASATHTSQPETTYITPIVRKLAREAGVDLANVKGTGVGGRIRKEDVEKLAKTTTASTSASAQPAPVEISSLRGTSEPMSRLRKVISERAVASLNTTAQLTTFVEVDVTRIANLRAQVQADFTAKTGSKLSFLPFFVVAAAEALRTYPIINATLDGETIVYPATENISIAVDTERGLLTPVLRDAGDKSIATISKDIADLADRTRNNKLTPDELAGGTFTLTNTGSRGALFDTPLVFLPQVAILGTGTVVKRPVVLTGDEGDTIAIRSMMNLAISYDHRIIDGADAARFLGQVKNRLEQGAFEANLGI